MNYEKGYHCSHTVATKWLQWFDYTQHRLASKKNHCSHCSHFYTGERVDKSGKMALLSDKWLQWLQWLKTSILLCNYRPNHCSH